jgi:hypothetical protein
VLVGGRDCASYPALRTHGHGDAGSDSVLADGCGQHRLRRQYG